MGEATVVLKTGAEVSEGQVRIIMAHLRQLSTRGDAEFDAYFALVTNCRVPGFGYQPEAKQLLVDLHLIREDGSPHTADIREVVLSAVEDFAMILRSPLKE